MNIPFSTDCATVLDREFRGETSVYITAFAHDVGLMRMMKKCSVKKTSSLPDLFDDIAISGEMQSPTSLKFARDFDIIKRRNDIATNYNSFEHACKISLSIVKNGAHIEDCAKLSTQLRSALDAIANGASAEIVRLKFMYLLAKNEGYPVKEDFYARLPQPQKELFSLLIKLPALELKDYATRTEPVLESYLNWLYSNTDIIE